MNTNLSTLVLTLAITIGSTFNIFAYEPGTVSTGALTISEKYVEEDAVEQINTAEQTMVFNRVFSSQSTISVLMQIKIQNKVTKADGTTVDNDPNIISNIIMDNGQTYIIQKDKNNVDKIKYALLVAYKPDGKRFDNNFYLLVTKPSDFNQISNDINIKIKSFIDENAIHEYRGAKIEVNLSAMAGQMNVDDAISDIYWPLDLVKANPDYFNLPTPVNGTIDEFSTSSNDLNSSQKSLVSSFFVQLRS